MQILESTLLTGPYDWDEQKLPRSEFAARLERVRAAMSRAGAAALIVHGDPRNYGALAYLTGFTPKLGATLALVLPEGPLHIFAPGTPKMMDIAKRLTWVEDVTPIGNAPKRTAESLGDGKTLATWAFDTLPQSIYNDIVKAIAPRALMPLDAELDPMRRRKSPCELALMRDAARFLTAATDAFAANIRTGHGARSAGLAAERAAIAAGAQDARAMTSLSAGGAPLPLDAASDDRTLDPVNVGIAVQNHGYWASGYVTVSSDPAASAKARNALANALAAAKGGAKLPGGIVANAIGIELEEASGASLEAGEVYAVTSKATEGGTTAYASALIAVTENGCETLWQGP